MAQQSLIWRGVAGNLTLPQNWTPQEAPTPGINQNLRIPNGIVEVTGGLAGYDIDLLGTGPTSLTLLGGSIIDSATTISHEAGSAGVVVVGTVSNRGTLQFGASGDVVTNSTITLTPTAAFTNEGTIKVLGNLNFDGPGAFANNGTLTVDGGTAVLRGMNGGSERSTFQIEDAGTLQIVGITQGTVTFTKGETGTLRFETPNAQNSIADVYGFGADDTIRVAGTATDKVWQPDPGGGGGRLLLTGAGQIDFKGDYTADQFSFDASQAGYTVVKTSKADTPVVVVPPTTTDPNTSPVKPVLNTNDSVLDLSRYGRKDAIVSGSGADTTIELHNVSVKGASITRADFIGGVLSFDASSPGGRYTPDADAAAIARLYYTQLGRAPEFAGLKYWVETLDAQNWNVSDVADDFHNSREFQTRFGTSQTNAQYVDQLYQNILGRAGEQGGRDFWTGQLNNGVGRDVVAVVGFSESIEHKAIRYASIEQGGIAFIDQPFL